MLAYLVCSRKPGAEAVVGAAGLALCLSAGDEREQRGLVSLPQPLGLSSSHVPRCPTLSKELGEVNGGGPHSAKGENDVSHPGSFNVKTRVRTEKTISYPRGRGASCFCRSMCPFDKQTHLLSLPPRFNGPRGDELPRTEADNVKAREWRTKSKTQN